MTELLAAVGTLAIILIGIAVLLQMISVEDVLRNIGRAMTVILLMLVALCILKSLWLSTIVPELSASFEFVKSLAEWLIVAVVGAIALLTVGRVVLRRFARYLPLRRDPLNGDGYEIHDSKEERD
jgi:Na+/phosphate symporter